jgi:hypothetical protein
MSEHSESDAQQGGATGRRRLLASEFAAIHGGGEDVFALTHCNRFGTDCEQICVKVG